MHAMAIKHISSYSYNIEKYTLDAMHIMCENLAR